MTIKRVLAKMTGHLALLGAVACGASSDTDDDASIDMPKSVEPAINDDLLATGASRETRAEALQAITVPCSAPTADQVRVASTSGTSICLGDGVYNTASEFSTPDDSVDYVTLGSNMTAYLYDLPSLQGRPYQVLTTGFLPQTIRSLASSIVVRHKVQCGQPAANEVVLYVDAPPGDEWPTTTCARLGVGEYRDAFEMGIPNDSLSAIAVGANVQVDAFQDARFGGSMTNYPTSITAVTTAWNDVISSLKVRWARNCPAPAFNEVVFWENANFSGRCTKLKVGNYKGAADMGFPNDALSAVQAGSVGVEAGLYVDANYGSYIGSVQSGAVPAAVNDLTSSVRVRWAGYAGGCPEPKPNQVTIYRDSWYQGPCKVLDEGDYAGPDQFGIDNDSVSSVKVGGSVNLVLYKDANYGGQMFNTRTSGELVLGVDPNGTATNFADTTSSLRVVPRHLMNPYASVSKPLLVLKCKGAGVPEDTGSQAYLEDLLTATGKGTGNFYDYFTEQTYGTWNLTSVTFKGWYTMVSIPQGTPRIVVAQRCVEAAASAGFTFNEANYASVIILTNWSPLDDGATGYGAKRVVIHAGNWTNLMYLTHEVGHAFGLTHSRSTSNPVDYQERWDLMSAGNVFATSGAYGTAAPGLNAFYRKAMGVIQPSRRIVLPNDLMAHTYTLVPLADNALPGYHYVEVPAAIAGVKLLVSFRMRTGFDSAFPTAQSVFIHEDRNDGFSYVVDSSPGAEFTSSEQYSRGAVKITVMGTSDINGAVVKFEPRAPCQGGFMCCNKWYCPPDAVSDHLPAARTMTTMRR